MLSQLSLSARGDAELGADTPAGQAIPPAAQNEAQAASPTLPTERAQPQLRSESGAAILVRGADGGYAEAPSEWDGRYLVFALENGGSFAVSQQPERPDLRLFALIGGGALLVLLVVVRAASRRRRARRKSAKKTEKSAQKETK